MAIAQAKLIVPRTPRTRRGFTLIEMIVTILLLAILSAGITRFIEIGSEIYVDVAAREQLLSESRFVLERITRDIRSAVPNSVRVRSGAVSGTQVQCLELLPLRGSASYIDLPVLTAAAQAQVIKINNYSFSSGDQMLVYPLLTDHVYANSGRRHTVTAISDVSGEEDLQQIDFAAATQFAADSPGKRFYLAAQPLSYCVRNGSVYLHLNYGYQSSQPLFASGGLLMATQVSNNLIAEPVFRFAGATLNRNALVIVRLRLTRVDDAETLAYNHEVQVPNVP
ncbi:prepilin-type N-terminal cleavage/methylation domain-containing protein [Corallincola luteus]|uniref:Prepilin-type N-terminal cleavage/methylation domain-containing protein n=1 Tax=Corallincola luteus TaxID=1775177 RepID=A0ABY2AKU6_9GAMM|nr:prepilin-type N-terminal cleavage/methylation domain-containing protein [Corallincola luteus]TCI03533.1 prepilin-type N-terminal cleavage/methylation domain-containing protein [Corallincola luteus]